MIEIKNIVKIYQTGTVGFQALSGVSFTIKDGEFVAIMGFRAALIVPIASIVISDLIIGNTSIFMFTWGSFALIGAGSVILRKLNDKPKSQVLYSIGFAAISSFLFFVITNFGVWAQGWYPPTFAGLIDCFVMALPFYRTMLIGNLILVPSVVAAWQFVKARYASTNLVVDTLIR